MKLVYKKPLIDEIMEAIWAVEDKDSISHIEVTTAEHKRLQLEKSANGNYLPVDQMTISGVPIVVKRSPPPAHE